MMTTSADGRRGRFAVSLFPEVFFALGVLAEAPGGDPATWQGSALAAFPHASWPLHLPAAMWPALADLPRVGPTADPGVLLRDLAGLPRRAVQERFLGGLLHDADAVAAILAGDDPARVLAGLPARKREWLAFVDLYPYLPGSPAARALGRVVAEPEAFRRAIVATVRGFWDAVFAATWQALQPGLRASAATQRRRFASLRFAEFLRHTLLPIEYDPARAALVALRGGYRLPAAEMAACTLIPSPFNRRRLWTVRRRRRGVEPWLPYLEPDLGAAIGLDDGDPAAGADDVALVFRALGDPTRFALVTLIGRKPRTSVELARLAAVSRATISHHVHVLRSAGLIRELAHGGAVLIALRRRSFARISELALARIFESRGAVKSTRTRRSR